MELCRELSNHADGVSCAAIGAKTGKLFASAGRDRLVRVWNTEEAFHQISSHTSPECLSFNDDESLLAYGTLAGSLHLCDLVAQKYLTSFSGHKGTVRVARHNAQKPYLWATGSLDSTVKLWDTRAGKKSLLTFQNHNKSVSTLQFSPHGLWLVSGADDCTLKLLDIGSGKAFGEISGHSGPLADARFHPSEYLLASGSADKTVRFWDLETFECVSQSDPTATAVSHIVFHPGGDCLLSANGQDVRVCGWEPYHLFACLPISPSPAKVLDLGVDTADNKVVLLCASAQNKVSLHCAQLTKLAPFCVVEPTEASHDQNQEPQEQSKTTTTPFLQRSRLRRSFNEKVDPSWCNDDSTSNSSLTMSSSPETSPEHRPPVPELVISNEQDAFKARPKLSRSPPVSPSIDCMVPPAQEDTLTQTFVVHKVEQPKMPPTGTTARKSAASSPLMPRKSPINRGARSGQMKPSRSGTVIAAVRPQPMDKKVEKVSPLPRVAVADSLSAHSQSNPDFGSTYTVPESRLGAKVHADDFLPPTNSGLDSCARVLSSVQRVHSEQDCLKSLHAQSSSMQAVLRHRASSVNVLRRVWKVQGLRKAAQMVVDMNDASLLLELLIALNRRSSLWSLDLSNLLLPQMHTLLDSKHDLYVQTAVHSLRLITSGLGEAIKQGATRMPSIGVDVMQEERTDKCRKCYSQLASIRQAVAEKQKLGSNGPGRAQAYREIGVLMQLLD